MQPTEQSIELIEQWAQLSDPAAQQHWLAAHAALFDDRLAAATKDEANRLLRVDIRRSLAAAALLQALGTHTGILAHQALGLRASADAHAIGLGEFQAALDHYRAAATIYESLGDQIERTRTEASMIWSLASLGQYAQALAIGDTAQRELRAHAQWRPLATLTMNLAIIHGRLGSDQAALDLLDQARTIWLMLESPSGPLARIEQNRAILLRNLGQFERSLEASQEAHQRLSELGQQIEAARAHQNLAVTYYTLGRYNEALELLDQVRGTFQADGRERDTLLVDLFISDCLIQLRRFPAALSICQRARALFDARGVQLEAAQSLLNEAIARAGLRQHAESLVALDQARDLFHSEGMPSWVATSDLERALVLLHQQRYVECLEHAMACRALFAERGLPLPQLRSTLIAARAMAALGMRAEAVELASGAIGAAEQLQLTSLIYQGHQLLGSLAAEDAPAEALAHYQHAIAALERLRAHLMVEFRADFLDDKQAVYADAVALWLRQGQPEQALQTIERAKSRALRDLLAQRLDLSIRSRSEADRPLTESLDRLQAERNRLVRRWESRELAREDPGRADQERVQAHQELLAIEQQITDQWHRLLVRNADYARDAALWQPYEPPSLPRPPATTIVVEYVALRDRLVVFLVTAEETRAIPLAATLREVERLLRFLWLNLNAVPGCAPEQLPDLAANARHLLRQLYDHLVAPCAAELARYEHLVVVPHGALHYLPFHALFDGQGYLIERIAISSLPSINLLGRAATDQAESGALVVGYSQSGRLPHVVVEATAVAQLLGARPLLEEAATRAAIAAQISEQRVVHLATHGEFRTDSPLFSGLACADGRLTTLDLFGMRLRASLVTLSACQSGRSVVGGGDELLGMMRACLHSGAAALLVTLWAIEDQATTTLMRHFYQGLAAGQTKGAALRDAQRAAIQTSNPAHDHPFFWAAFTLVGDAGPL